MLCDDDGDGDGDGYGNGVMMGVSCKSTQVL